MKISLFRSLYTVLFATLIMAGNASAQSTETASAQQAKKLYEPGPHGGLICPASNDFKFEMVYNESAKKIDFYFMNPDNSAFEASNLTGEITFVNEDKSVSKVNAAYEGKKFTTGVPDGKPLYMCGIVINHGGQMYGGKFVNPSMIK